MEQHYSTASISGGDFHNVELTGQKNIHHAPEKKLNVITQWFSPLTFSQKQKDVFQEDYFHGAKTFLRSSVLSDWESTPNAVLWCHGMPGAGKTVLTSVLFEHLVRSTRDNSKLAVSCIYCDFKKLSDQTPERIIASLWPQLWLRENEALLSKMETLYEKHLENQTTPDMEEIKNLVQMAMDQYDEAFVLIDAFDEIEPRDRAKIARELNQLLEGRASVHLFITSREQKYTLFPGAKEMEFRASNREIAGIVRRCLDSPDMFESQSIALKIKEDGALRDEIITAVVTKADGMFLSAKLHLDSLYQLMNVARLRTKLNSLPSGLNGIYDDAWKRVQNQDEDRIAMAQYTIWWLCLSPRLLKIEELRHALAVEHEDIHFQAENLSAMEDIRKCCKGLVAIEPFSQTVRLVHYTAQRYLEGIIKGKLDEVSTHLTRTCLTYLSFEEFQKPCKFLTFHVKVNPQGKPYQKISKRRFLPARLEEYPFLEYAAEHWGLHARGRPERSCEDMILRFLSSGPTLRNALMAQYKKKSLNVCEGIDVKIHLLTPIQIAVSFSLTHVLRLLLHAKQVERSELNNHEGRSALHWAEQIGNADMIEALVQAGVDLKHPEKDSQQILLHKSITEGRDVVIDLLLKHEVIIDALWQTIKYAIYAENLNVLQEYVSSKTDQMARLVALNDVLTYATRHGITRVMEFVLANGASVDFETNKNRALTVEAIHNARAESLRLLLKAGAAPSANDHSTGLTLLQTAADTIEIFKHRLRVLGNMDLSQRPTALKDQRWLAFENQLQGWQYGLVPWPKLPWVPEFVELLREDAANVEIIQMLIEYSADIQEVTSQGCTLLHLAFHSTPRLETILKYCDQGSQYCLEVNAQDNEGRRPLHYAAAAACFETMELLISRGADIFATDKRGATTLHFAVGDTACTSLILRVGGDVQARDNRCRTPYHYAKLLEEPQQDVLEMLGQQPRIKINAVDVDLKTAHDYHRDLKNYFRHRGHEENTLWIGEMLISNPLLPEIVSYKIHDSHWASQSYQEQWLARLAGSGEAKKTWQVVSDSEEEDYDSSTDTAEK